MYNLNWSRPELNRQKLGTFGEYYAKMALASFGLSIYTSEIDDHGIDFIAETNHRFFKFQVKTIRQGTNYVFMKKKYFDISDNSLYLILVMLKDGEHPKLYIIPASAWDASTNSTLVYRSYEGNKSEPEYGINLSIKNLSSLDVYRMETMLPIFSNYR